jgi:hypothetical protein
VTAAPQLIAATTPETLLACYEDLRETAVGHGVGVGRGVGLALFIRRGMAVWMQTCASLVRPRGSTLEQVVPPSLRPLRGEVAMVLAEMALSAHTQGAMTS